MNCDVIVRNPAPRIPIERAWAAACDMESRLALCNGLLFGLLPGGFGNREGLLTNGPLCENVFRGRDGLRLELTALGNLTFEARSFLGLGDGLFTNGLRCEYTFLLFPERPDCRCERSVLGSRTVLGLSALGLGEGLLTNGPCWGKTFLLLPDRLACLPPDRIELGNRTVEGLSLLGPGDGLFTKGPCCGNTFLARPDLDPPGP